MKFLPQRGSELRRTQFAWAEEGDCEQGVRKRTRLLNGDEVFFGIGLARSARPAARPRAQGVGRRRLPGPDRGDQRGRAQGSGHDLPQNEIQEPRGRVTTPAIIKASRLCEPASNIRSASSSASSASTRCDSGGWERTIIDCAPASLWSISTPTAKIGPYLRRPAL